MERINIHMSVSSMKNNRIENAKLAWATFGNLRKKLCTKRSPGFVLDDLPINFPDHWDLIFCSFFGDEKSQLFIKHWSLFVVHWWKTIYKRVFHFQTQVKQETTNHSIQSKNYYNSHYIFSFFTIHQVLEVKTLVLKFFSSTRLDQLYGPFAKSLLCNTLNFKF